MTVITFKILIFRIKSPTVPTDICINYKKNRSCTLISYSWGEGGISTEKWTLLWHSHVVSKSEQEMWYLYWCNAVCLLRFGTDLICFVGTFCVTLMACLGTSVHFTLLHFQKKLQKSPLYESHQRAFWSFTQSYWGIPQCFRLPGFISFRFPLHSDLAFSMTFAQFVYFQTNF